MEVDDLGPNLLEEIRISLDQERVRYPVPPMIVVAGQKQKLVRALVEPGDPRAAFVQGRIVGIDRCQQDRTVLGVLAQLLEQLVADLLRAAAHQFGVEKADQEDGFLFAHNAT